MEETGWIQGLKIVAVVVVAHAILGMAQKLTPDLKGKSIALFALVITLLWQTAFTQVGVILLAGLIGYLVYKNHAENEESKFVFPISRKLGAFVYRFFRIAYFASDFKRSDISELDCYV